MGWKVAVTPLKRNSFDRSFFDVHVYRNNSKKLLFPFSLFWQVAFPCLWCERCRSDPLPQETTLVPLFEMSALEPWNKSNIL